MVTDSDLRRLVRLLASADPCSDDPINRKHCESFIEAKAPELMHAFLEVVGPRETPNQLEFADDAWSALDEAMFGERGGF